MSLNWDITKCNQELVKGEANWPLTNILIFQTMQVGLGSIKDEAEAKEFYTRSRIASAMFGKPISYTHSTSGEHADRDFTLKEIQDRIGLRTNVSKETRAQFLKRMMQNLVRETEYNVNREAIRLAEEQAVQA